MWLRNYYNLLTAMMLADDTLSSTTQPTSYNPPIMVHKPDGNWRNIYYSRGGDTSVGGGMQMFLLGKHKAVLATSATPSVTMSDADVCIALGTGTTAPSYEDYRIETPITSGLSIVSAAGNLATPTAYDSDTHHISSERNFTINNTTVSNITINEIALYVKHDTGAGDLCCVYREVLDEPITLGQSESVIISFKRDAEVYNYTPYPA